MSLSDLCPNDDVVARRVLHGLMARCLSALKIFCRASLACVTTEEQVAQFQKPPAAHRRRSAAPRLIYSRPAMSALLKARVQARAERPGNFHLEMERSCAPPRLRRHCAFLELRFLPALTWTKLGRLSNQDAIVYDSLPWRSNCGRFSNLRSREYF